MLEELTKLQRAKEKVHIAKEDLNQAVSDLHTLRSTLNEQLSSYGVQMALQWVDKFPEESGIYLYTKKPNVPGSTYPQPSSFRLFALNSNEKYDPKDWNMYVFAGPLSVLPLDAKVTQIEQTKASETLRKVNL